ncbi:MAG: hypothetical protein CYG59_04525, partial [Chloroflexi bacterium]
FAAKFAAQAPELAAQGPRLA